MSRSEHRSHRLTIDAPYPGLSVTVIDAGGSIVGRCGDDEPQVELELPAGLYTLRSSRSGAFTETVIRLAGSRTVQAAPPPVFSAAMIPGAKSTHEYYTYPAWQASYQMTADEQSWDGHADSQLLLFVRALNKGAYTGEDQLASLSLRTVDRRILTTFRWDARRDQTSGWSAYSARMSVGLLILEDRGEPARQVPVPLLAGWQTQIYLIHNTRLLWEDMRVTMVRLDDVDSREYRDPYNEHADDVWSAVDVDAGLLALQNNAPGVAPQLIRSFLGGKFKNPIVGLLGAYLMLMNYRREYVRRGSDFHPDSALVQTVLENLDRLLPASADVAALRLLAKDWVRLPKLDSIEGMPLFRAGAEILLQAAASDIGLLREGALLDAVSGGLYGDTVWSTWKPVPLSIDGRSITGSMSGTAASELNWVELAVLDVFAAAGRQGKSLGAEELVRRLGVSPHTVRSAMESLSRRMTIREAVSEIANGAEPLLRSHVGLELARELGSRFGKVMWNFVGAGAPNDAVTANRNIQQVYASLERALFRFANPSTGKISADKVLAEVLKCVEEPCDRWVVSEVIDLLNAGIQTHLQTKPPLALEGMFVRDELRQAAGLPVPESDLQPKDVWTEVTRLAKFFAELPATWHRKALESFRENTPEWWAPVVLTLNEVSAELAGECARLLLLEGHGQLLMDTLTRLVIRHQASSDLLLWLGKERSERVAARLGPEVFRAMISAMERDAFNEKNTNLLHDFILQDQQLLPDLIEAADIEIIKDLVRTLQLSCAFDDMDKRTLLGRIGKVYPAIHSLISGEKSMDNKTFLVSWDSLQRRKSEYDHLVNKEIPANAKDIAIARSNGDLRQNQEFKAAKEVQRALYRRKDELEMQLVSARGTDFTDRKADVVSPGTLVTLTDLDTGKVESVQILGAWDGDPDRNIFSYLSPLAQSLINRPVGAEVKLELDGQRHRYRIDRILAWQADPAVDEGENAGQGSEPASGE